MTSTLEILHDGTKEWRNDAGVLHRTDGPAFESANGTKCWYISDNLHRQDGPAVEWFDGDRSWWVRGRRHREDGPAVELTNGEKEWYIHGSRYSFDEYCIKMYGSLDHPKALMLQVKYG